VVSWQLPRVGALIIVGERRIIVDFLNIFLEHPLETTQSCYTIIPFLFLAGTASPLPLFSEDPWKRQV